MRREFQKANKGNSHIYVFIIIYLNFKSLR